MPHYAPEGNIAVRAYKESSWQRRTTDPKLDTMLRNLSGIWKADLKRSKLLGPLPNEMVVQITHSEPALSVEMTIVAMDGREHKIKFQGSTSGEEASNTILGAPWRSRFQWLGSELLIESWVKQNDRELHFRDFWSISSDGQVLTMAHRDDDLAGQVTIFHKVQASSRTRL